MWFSGLALKTAGGRFCLDEMRVLSLLSSSDVRSDSDESCLSASSPAIVSLTFWISVQRDHRCLILMRRILVLLVALSMESLVAYCRVLLLVSDCEMFARLEQRLVSGVTSTGVDRRLDFVVWQRFEIRRSHSSRLRRCVSLCRWRRLDRMEVLGFDLERSVYFCIRWRSSCRVALVWDLPF